MTKITSLIGDCLRKLWKNMIKTLICLISLVGEISSAIWNKGKFLINYYLFANLLLFYF